MEDLQKIIKRIVNEGKGKVDPLSDYEKRFMAIINGDEPLNDYERGLKKQIEYLKAEGKTIEIPFM